MCFWNPHWIRCTGRSMRACVCACVCAFVFFSNALTNTHVQFCRTVQQTLDLRKPCSVHCSFPLPRNGSDDEKFERGASAAAAAVSDPDPSEASGGCRRVSSRSTKSGLLAGGPGLGGGGLFPSVLVRPWVWGGGDMWLQSPFHRVP